MKWIRYLVACWFYFAAFFILIGATFDENLSTCKWISWTLSGLGFLACALFINFSKTWRSLDDA